MSQALLRQVISPLCSKEFMENPKDRRTLKNLKLILITSIPIYLFSSYLTGIRIHFISIDGQIIDRGYYEHFTFLIIASIVLACLLLVVHFLVPSIDNTKIKFGLKAVSSSLLLFGSVLLFCIFSSLFNADNKWKDFEFFLVFFAAVPSTVSFLLGLLVMAYGWILQIKNPIESKKHKALSRRREDSGSM